MRQIPKHFARPLWQHLRLEPPLGDKLKFRAKVPYSEIDLDQATSSLRSSFATYRPSAKVISKRSGSALVVQFIEFEVDASAVGHTAFGVMDKAGCDGGAEALPPCNGPLNLLGNWRIGIALGHEDKFVHIP